MQIVDARNSNIFAKNTRTLRYSSKIRLAMQIGNAVQPRPRFFGERGLRQKGLPLKHLRNLSSVDGPDSWQMEPARGSRTRPRVRNFSFP